jgi:hypothetical protein
MFCTTMADTYLQQTLLTIKPYKAFSKDAIGTHISEVITFLDAAPTVRTEYTPVRFPKENGPVHEQFANCSWTEPSSTLSPGAEV